MANAVLVIRWGAEVSSDKLRRRARCTACGHNGATIQHPGCGGADIGFLPFPVSRYSVDKPAKSERSRSGYRWQYRGLHFFSGRICQLVTRPKCHPPIEGERKRSKKSRRPLLAIFRADHRLVGGTGTGGVRSWR